MFNLTSEADEATEVIAELGSFVHPVTDIVSEVHQMADAAGDNGMFQWNLVVLYIQSPI